MEIDLSKLKTELETDLKKQVISSRILLDRMRLIDENSRRTGAYADPLYIPFYYYLGKHVQPKSLLELGFGLGLSSACFLKSCTTVESMLAFQENHGEFYSPRFAQANLKSSYRKPVHIHIGDISDEVFTNKVSSQKWDLVLINEELGYDKYMTYLDTAWESLALGGLVVLNHVSSDKAANIALQDLCKIRNRTPITISTRYGTGIIQK